MTNKKCPKCDKEHEKNGNYCSRSCANSRKFSKKSKVWFLSFLHLYHNRTNEHELLLHFLFLSDHAIVEKFNMIDVLTENRTIFSPCVRQNLMQFLL